MPCLWIPRRGPVIRSFPQKRAWIVWLSGLLLAALLTGLIYAPGLSGGLHLDSGKLYQVEQVYREQGAAVDLGDLSFARQFGRVIPQFSFYLNIAVSDGVDPYEIKLTNVVIHLINAIMVFLFVTMVLQRTRYREQSRHLAAAVALLWLISAVNVNGVLYAVQRMNQLATLFSLAALVLYLRVRGASAGRPFSAARWLALATGVSLLAVLAYACKENALLIPIFIMFIEMFLFPDLPKWLGTKAGKATAVTVLLVLITLLIVFLPGSSLLDYSQRTFTLEERVLTQARILWIYIGQLLVPTTGAIGLYQDGIPVSTGLFAPTSTVAALAGLAGLVVFAVGSCRHQTLGIIAFGLAFFLAGHSLESSVFPLELYYEHRNYLPSTGLYLAFVVSAYWLLQRIPMHYAAGIAVIYLVGIAFVAQGKAVTWSDQRLAYGLALERDYLSPRAAAGMAQLYLEEGKVAPAMALLDRVIAESPHEALRARLQKLYIQCATGAPLDEQLHAQLASVTGRELAIEVSQAISNAVNVYSATRCAAISVERLIASLRSISAALRADGRSSWHIDYYIGELYGTFDNRQAAGWLEKLFLDGEESAGWALIEMLKRDERIRVDPGTADALEVLGARAP